MIQNNELIGLWQAGCQEHSKGPRDALRSKIAPGVIVAAHDEDTGVMPSDEENQLVQKLEIVVIVRQQDATFTDGEHQVPRVFAPHESDRCWNDRIVPILCEELDKYGVCGVIIQVEVHRW